jgi:hypothetical protein
MKPSNGYVIHETDELVVIATGFRDFSHNRKTGAMIQTWILVKAQDPITAARVGEDRHVCGVCPLRGSLTLDAHGKFKNVGRACYVNLGQAPLQIWKAWKNGNYPTLDHVHQMHMFAGRAVRFGAYGEPVLIPIDIVRSITKVASTWTGYTHMWQEVRAVPYKEFFMASTDVGNYRAAQIQGWRTFTVSATKIDSEVTCPASAEAGHRTTCDQCKLCGGASVKAKSIQIMPHGRGQKYAIAA